MRDLRRPDGGRARGRPARRCLPGPVHGRRTASCSPPRASGWRSPHPTSEAGDLLREADTAMYAAKEAGRDRVSLFNEDLRTIDRDADDDRGRPTARARPWPARRLVPAGGRPEQRARSIAVEALLRWHHPDGSVWTADRFVDVAEETGLILDIGDWVLRQACLQAAAWATARPDRPVTVRVNVSALQLAETGLLEAHRRRPRRERAGPGPAVRGDHRDRAAAAHDDHGGEPRCHPRPRHLPRHRRLRHRLRLADLPQPVPRRRDQDRPQLHQPRRPARTTASSPASSPSPRRSTSP